MEGGNWRGVRANKITSLYTADSQAAAFAAHSRPSVFPLNESAAKRDDFLASQQARLGAAAHALCTALTRLNDVTETTLLGGSLAGVGHLLRWPADPWRPSRVCAAGEWHRWLPPSGMSCGYWRRNAPSFVEIAVSSAWTQWWTFKPERTLTKYRHPKHSSSMVTLMLWFRPWDTGGKHGEPSDQSMHFPGSTPGTEGHVRNTATTDSHSSGVTRRAAMDTPVLARMTTLVTGSPFETSPGIARALPMEKVAFWTAAPLPEEEGLIIPPQWQAALPCMPPPGGTSRTVRTSSRRCRDTC